jgi:hypothetical protein
MPRQRLQNHVEVLTEKEADIQTGRGTLDQIFVIHQLAEQFSENNRTLCNNFINVKQAFDNVWQLGSGKTPYNNR